MVLLIFEPGGLTQLGEVHEGGDNAFMSSAPAVYSPDSMQAEKRAVAGGSVLASLAITILKIIVGISSGSLGILSEAAHSGLDLVAAIITFVSISVSDKPADADHQWLRAWQMLCVINRLGSR